MIGKIKLFTQSLRSQVNDFCLRHGITIDEGLEETNEIDLFFIEIREKFQDIDLKMLNQIINNHSSAMVFLFTSEFSQTVLIQAMRVGVREVLHVDSTATELDQALERGFLKENHQVTKQKKISREKQVVSFLPCKGGNGATLLACNLGYYLAKDAEQEFSFIDLDLHSGDATFYLCNDLQKNSLSDLTNQIERLDSFLLKSSLHTVLPNFNLLAAPLNAEHALTMKPDHIDKVISLARDNFELVLIDLNSALNAITLKVLDHSDVVCIVMDFSIMQLRDAKRLLMLLISLGYSKDKFRFIGIEHANFGEVTHKKIEESLGMPLYLIIPGAAKAAAEACNQGLPLSEISGGHVIMNSIQKLADMIFNISPQKNNRWLASWF